MKIYLFALLFGLGSLVQTCSRPHPIVAANSPEQTFEALVAAIQAKDLAAYTQCWYTETAEREGMITRLKTDDKKWADLQAKFKGPQTLKADREYEEDGLQVKKFVVQSPEVPEGKGIGSIAMVKVGDTWKMYHW